METKQVSDPTKETTPKNYNRPGHFLENIFVKIILNKDNFQTSFWVSYFDKKKLVMHSIYFVFPVQ